MKRPLVLLLLVLMTATVWAQQISEEQARDRALKYLTANDAAQSRGMKVAMDRKLVRARTDAKRIYAFNLEGGGYVIASGDSRALPVLGYSATGTIDWDRMPDNMRAWLKSYDEAMATLGDTKVFTDGVSTYGQKTRAPREAPMESVGAVLERYTSLRRCQSRLAGAAVANRLCGHGDGDGDELLPMAERSLHGDSRL